MRHLANALVKIVIVAMVLGLGYLLLQQSQQPEAVIALQEQQRLESMRRWHLFYMALAQALTLAAWIVAGAVCLIALSAAWLFLAKARKASQHIYPNKEGSYPVIIQQQGSLIDRARGNSRQLTMNPNLWALPSATVEVGPGGQPSIHEGTNGFTREQLLTMHAGQQRIQAKGKWKAERAPNRWEVLERNGLLPEPAQRALPAPVATVEETPGVKRLEVREALNQSTVDGFIMGQADNGKLLPLSLRAAVHVGIIGASGTGKTASTGFQLALAAMRHGFQLAVLDGKQGMDWTPFGAVAERHDTNKDNFLYQMECIYREYEHRLDVAKHHQVAHISDLNTTDYPPILVIVEEFGDLARVTKRTEMTKIENMLDSLGAKGRACAIHFALIDQTADNWSSVILGATKAKILYQMGDGGKVKDYHVVDLPDHGRFRYKKHEFNSWHVAPHLPKLIGDVQKAQAAGLLQRYPDLIDGSYTVLDERPGVPLSEGGSVSDETPGVDTPHRTSRTVPDSDPYHNDTRDKVYAYLEKYPDASVRTMADVLDISKTQVGVYRKEFYDQGMGDN